MISLIRLIRKMSAPAVLCLIRRRFGDPIDKVDPAGRSMKSMKSTLSVLLALKSHKWNSAWPHPRILPKSHNKCASGNNLPPHRWLPPFPDAWPVAAFSAGLG
jgi:hypothetical protein